MKSILCYGDSLTWGSDPGAERHKFEDRWPSVLGEKLGTDKVRIIAEGLGGRTTMFNDYSAPGDRNGATILPTILGSHQPLDCIIIMLGTNDLKNYICGNPVVIARGVGRLAEIVNNYAWWGEYVTPPVVMVAPPHCVATDDPLMRGVFENTIKASQRLSHELERVAEENKCTFFDAATVAVASPIDGVHLDAKNTRAIGKNLAPLIARLLNI